jgi:hypothetical protein
MYHRIDLRFPLVLPVMIMNYIDRSAYQILKGRIINISFTGMFVDSIAVPVPDTSHIYARITKKVCCGFSLGGFVVRQSNLGIGILFDDYNSDTGLQLGKLINQDFDHRNHLSAFASGVYGKRTNH